MPPEGRAVNCPGRKAPAPSVPGSQLFFRHAIVRIADLGQGAFSRELSKFFKTVFENARALAPAIFLWWGTLFLSRRKTRKMGQTTD
jgi:hypothetical protein